MESSDLSKEFIELITGVIGLITAVIGLITIWITTNNKKVARHNKNVQTGQRQVTAISWDYYIILTLTGLTSLLLPKFIPEVSFISIILILFATTFFAYKYASIWMWTCIVALILIGLNYLGYFLSGGEFAVSDKGKSLYCKFGLYYIIQLYKKIE